MTTEKIKAVLETADQRCPEGCEVKIMALTLAAELHTARAKSHSDDQRIAELEQFCECRRPQR
jgi:hypothetical protein